MKRLFFRHPVLCGRNLLACAIVCISSCQQPATSTHAVLQEPLPDSLQRLPENAVRGLWVRPGLKATLFACEPMITNPTDLDIDAWGRVWLTEGYNYRPQMNPGNPVRDSGDRIVVLQDTNGDGRADTATVFYQGNDVNAALGICVLGNHVIVSCSPNVFILTDTNGDLHADEKRVLFKGIAGFQHDHGIHAFSFGPDGKLYFNFGNAGDSILDARGQVLRDPEGRPINNHGHPYRQGMVFRCNPDGSDVEVLGYNFRNPYEVAVDAYGNLWQSDNDDDGNRGVRINYVMPYGNYGYTDELTGASWSSWRIHMEDSVPYRHWHLNDPGVVPNLLQTGSGAPTGMVVYEGTLLPKLFQGQIIHADALKRVVRSYIVEPKGAGFTASTVNLVWGQYDTWFRPSDVGVAPDGSLFIADWYDPGVGGHLVEDLNRGRVFRVAPPAAAYRIVPPDFSSPQAACRMLENPNLATRYLAWKRLHAWGLKAVPALDALYHHPNPRFRARALWLLSKIPDTGLHWIQLGLRDPDPDIRITAIRALEELPLPRLPLLQPLLRDPSAQVRRTLALALRHQTAPAAARMWAVLADQFDGSDRWYLEALGIAADGQWNRFFAAWLKLEHGAWDTRAGRALVWRSRARVALPLLASIIEDPSRSPSRSLRYFRAFHFHRTPEKEAVLLGLLNGHHPRQDMLNAYAFLVLDPHKVPRTPAIRRLLERSLDSIRGTDYYIRLLRRYQVKGHDSSLLNLALANQPSVSVEALKTLLQLGGAPKLSTFLKAGDPSARVLIGELGPVDDSVGKDLLQALVLDSSYPPALRKLAARSLGYGWDGEDRLVTLIQQGRLPALVDSQAADLLSHAYRPEVRETAERYFHLGPAGSTLALPPMDQLLARTGDPLQGKAVFEQTCTACHRIGALGSDFGPNLTEIGTKLSKQALLTSIITPDAGITFGFDGVVFRMKDGREILGYVRNETSREVEVKLIGGALDRLDPRQIASRKPYGHSLMPTGLAQAMGTSRLEDLVSYLMQQHGSGH